MYPWHDTTIFVPGNCRSVAKQLIRVVLHQVSFVHKPVVYFPKVNEEKLEFLPLYDWFQIFFSLPTFLKCRRDVD